MNWTGPSLKLKNMLSFSSPGMLNRACIQLVNLLLFIVFCNTEYYNTVITLLVCKFIAINSPLQWNNICLVVGEVVVPLVVARAGHVRQPTGYRLDLRHEGVAPPAVLLRHVVPEPTVSEPGANM